MVRKHDCAEHPTENDHVTQEVLTHTKESHARQNYAEQNSRWVVQNRSDFVFTCSKRRLTEVPMPYTNLKTSYCPCSSESAHLARFTECQRTRVQSEIASLQRPRLRIPEASSGTCDRDSAMQPFLESLSYVDDASSIKNHGRFKGTCTHKHLKQDILFLFVFVDASDDAPSQRDLTCAGASVTTKGRQKKINAPSAR